VLAPPDGYCALDAGKRDERNTILQQRSMLGMAGEMPIVFADCGQLNDLRAGRATTLDNFGSLTIDKTNGKIVPLYGVSRQQFVNQVVDAIRKSGLERLKDETDASVARVGLNVKIDTSAARLLDHDDTAIYVGGTLTIARNGGTPASRDSIHAMTVVNGLKVGIEIARPSIGDTSLKLLLEQQHKNIAALLKANAANDTTTTVTSAWFDWRAIPIVAALFAPIVLILAVVLRTTKRRNAT
jgi:hypothetical protein